MYIKMHAEVFENGQWTKVGRCFKSALTEMKGYLTDRPCDERNVVLYEVLTGYHFRQNDKLTSITPIVKVKSAQNKTLRVTLKDLMAYNWNALISNVGCISEWQYSRYRGTDRMPANINKNVFGNEAGVVSPYEMDMILDGDSPRECEDYYVRFEYDERPIKNECKFFCETTIPALKKLIPESGSTKDVRIVYSLVGA